MLFTILKESKRYFNYENFLVSPEVIESSFQRCRETGVDPNLTQMPQLLHGLLTGNLLESSRQLLSIAKPVIKQDLYPYFINEDQLIILCNLDGYAIDLMSSPKTLKLCYGMNIGLGTCFREEVCGTNAISLAMHLKKMAVITGEQHYCQLFRDWSCIASPVRSPNGDIIGYLDISMDSEELLGHTLAMVRMTVKYIEKMQTEQLLERKVSKEIVSPETLARFKTLSIREKQVFFATAKGHTAGEIAGALSISEATVKTYRKRIYEKLEIKNKIACVNKARELGFPIE